MHRVLKSVIFIIYVHLKNVYFAQNVYFEVNIRKKMFIAFLCVYLTRELTSFLTFLCDPYMSTRDQILIIF